MPLGKLRSLAGRSSFRVDFTASLTGKPGHRRTTPVAPACSNPRVEGVRYAGSLPGIRITVPSPA